MKLALFPFAAFVAAAVVALYFAFQPAPKPPAPPKPTPARYWTAAKLQAQLAPLHPVTIALETPRGWVQVKGCAASSTQGLERVVLLCR